MSHCPSRASFRSVLLCLVTLNRRIAECIVMRWCVAIGTLVIGFRAPCLPNKVLLSRSENEVPGSLLFWSPPLPIWVALTFPKEANLCSAGTGRHRVRLRKKNRTEKLRASSID